MAKALHLVTDKEFQSEKDEDDKKTTWLLRTLTGLEFLRCTSSGYVDHEMIIALGLVGWRDFPDEESGKEIEFSVVNIGLISPLLLQDISFEIQTMSQLGAEERKNSSSQSKS